MNGIRHTGFAVALLVVLAMVHGIARSQAWYESSWPNTDFDLRSVDLSEIRGGGPPKDGIPSIDRPKFVDTETASDWLDPLEPVIAVSIAGQSRAYPLQILMYHEIVNDALGDVPISVTFCPLCNASIVFDRRVQGEVLDFGTTGMLRMSDLVMYDRQTESWWQQFSGQAIVGSWLGTELVRIPSSIISFESFRESHGDGMVLDQDTGFQRSYGTNPYTGYDEIGQNPFLFDGKPDGRLPAMERVLSITSGADNKIYPLSSLVEPQILNDHVGPEPVIVMSVGQLRSALDQRSISESRMLPEVTAWKRQTISGSETLEFELVDGAVLDRQTGSTWNLLGRAISGPLKGEQLEAVDSGVHFAFAWLAFNPESEIYKRPEG